MTTNGDGSNSTIRVQPIKYLTYNQREEKIEIIERNSPNISSITASSMLSALVKLKKVKTTIQIKSKAATIPVVSTTEPLTKVKTDGHLSKTKTKIIMKQPKTSDDSDRPSDPRQVKFETLPPNWAERPADIPEKCSVDLSCLLDIDHILMRPQHEPYLSGSTGYDIMQVYQILNLRDEILFLALEENRMSCCHHFRGSDRAFVLHLVDHKNNEIMKLHRPCQCCSNSLCIPSYIKVESPPGTVLGYFKEKFSLLHDIFELKLTPMYGRSKIRIEKLIFQCLWEPVQLKVISVEKRTECGIIKKPWAGRGDKWYHNNSEIIGVSFPPSIDVNSKALLIASLFLTDLIYY